MSEVYKAALVLLVLAGMFSGNRKKNTAGYCD
jgi:hypothetical protein